MLNCILDKTSTTEILTTTILTTGDIKQQIVGTRMLDTHHSGTGYRNHVTIRIHLPIRIHLLTGRTSQKMEIASASILMNQQQSTTQLHHQQPPIEHHRKILRRLILLPTN